MPGILPMKVIKVGSNAQCRIAQACDRCRSKKIRCDGIRPCCSQCANVGFECKTSDKLSRRAFPRGYTESLEERVRNLEAEARELKDLLDEKDEKIDILSKMHPNPRASPAASPNKETSNGNAEEVIRVQTSNLLFDSETSDGYFMGASSSRAFVAAFKRKIQESGKPFPEEIENERFLDFQEEIETPIPIEPNASIAPPRLFTDRMVNVFFQEWSPLFPILHKPTFLRLYEQFVEDQEQIREEYDLAQLYLVFGVAAFSAEAHDREQFLVYEGRWKKALDAFVMDTTLTNLQCLLLAQLFCIAKGDYKRLQYYKAIAVGLSHRLGLHQSQKSFSFGSLTMETRKRVFWSLYTIDCFSAASTGLPKLLGETDIQTEYPTDIDDEYITEKGFQPTLPGEYTKISSALALFRVSRILSKVLEKNYPASSTHDISFSTIASLDIELKSWEANLPKHLKLSFVQDKPSTDVTGNRSPLLSLAFYFIRTLIQRPALLGSSTSSSGAFTGARKSSVDHWSSSALITLADCSKHIIHIASLLSERCLAFSICLNREEILVGCGLCLLYQRVDLKQDGKMMRYGEELVGDVCKMIGKSKSKKTEDFTKLAVSMGIRDPLASLDASSGTAEAESGRRLSGDSFEFHAGNSDEHAQHQRRATAATISMPHMENVSLSDLSNDHRPFSGIAFGEHQYARSLSPPSISPRTHIRERNTKITNLDYLSLSGSHPPSPTLVRNGDTFFNNREGNGFNESFRESSPAEQAADVRDQNPPGWENILDSVSVDEAQIFDAMYGGTSLPLSLDASTSNSGSSNRSASTITSRSSEERYSASGSAPNSTTGHDSENDLHWRVMQSPDALGDFEGDIELEDVWDVGCLTLCQDYDGPVGEIKRDIGNERLVEFIAC